MTAPARARARIPAPRPAPPAETDRAAAVVAEVLVLLAQDGNGERWLANPRCGGCVGTPDPCGRCAAVARLAEIATGSPR